MELDTSQFRLSQIIANLTQSQKNNQNKTPEHQINSSPSQEPNQTQPGNDIIVTKSWIA